MDKVASLIGIPEEKGIKPSELETLKSYFGYDPEDDEDDNENLLRMVNEKLPFDISLNPFMFPELYHYVKEEDPNSTKESRRELKKKLYKEQKKHDKILNRVKIKSNV